MTKDIEWKSWWNYLFVDSGAFSVSQGTAAVQLKDYITFIKKNADKINHYAALDVVGDGKTSLENWKKMRKAGLYPIPVYHDGEPIEILEEYVSECSYVGLGAVAYKSRKSRQIFFDKIFSMFPDRKKVGFHGFGVMNPSFLERYPWRSVDSSKLSMVCRMGAIFCPNHLGSAVSISDRSSHANKSRWKTVMSIAESYNESALDAEFSAFGLSYKKACRADVPGMLERIFFSLEFMETHLQIPSTFNPSQRIVSLF